MESNKNHITFAFLQAQGYEFFDNICFLLKANKASQTQIAKSVHVERPFVSQVLKGERDSKKVKRAISKSLGFDPWSSG